MHPATSHPCRAAFAGLVLALLISGCNTWNYGRDRMSWPVTISEAVELSQRGVDQDAIIAQMNRGATVYNLSEEQYKQIRRLGITPKVIDYMQDTYTQAVEDYPRLGEDETMSCWYLGYDGYWYGGGAFGFHPDC